MTPQWLIREVRAGSGAPACPPTSAEEQEGLRLRPDGGFARLPERVSQREAFVLEGGWLPASHEVLLRR